MRLTRIYLRNYRVYEEPMELELPPGLVGVYGLNGAGKSSLIESIRFALYGRARTSLDEVRTSGVNGDCIAEVGFEHEGHLYAVRRTITGAGSTVRAQGFADGLQVAEGVRDTTRYVHSVLGMDDAAFRASVFAEQKQLAAFSEQAPADRRRLVLQLLGITPLDGARDSARRDARSITSQFERLRTVLPDLDAVRAAVAEAQVAVSLAEERADADKAAAETAALALEAAAARCEMLDGLRQEHDRLATECRVVEAERDRAAEGSARLAAEVADLDFAVERLARLAPLAEGWKEVEARLRVVESVAAAQAALTALPAAVAVEHPDEAGWEAAQARAADAKANLAAVSARLDAARGDRDRARVAVERSSRLDGAADCPLCGQALGESFAAVQSHRAAELSAVEGQLLDLELDQRRAAKAATATAERSLVLGRELKAAHAAWADNERLVARRFDAEQALAQAQGALGRPLREGER
ncbi:MAG: AAA family ATPase, partial [Acidimicrobiales bacterium]